MRLNYPVFFFSKKEKEKILVAIREAEKNTSGEVRVHLEYKTRGPVYAQAQKVFQKIGMTKTAQRNGVLIFLATHDRKFAVLGDTGINEKVPEGFWNDVVLIMESHFRENKFAEGIAEAAVRIGEKLREYFPYRVGDKNELPDGISY
ncbi:MAG TPA: TPM domain-containing protein [Candidatus Omnitrophota bacterium]|nr:TPM domain-containing protein [Candidatus Omnitrophota bacterium]HPS37400.1 TPM domain-containing protein [Candidatus Omnitrophota bacterium]